MTNWVKLKFAARNCYFFQNRTHHTIKIALITNIEHGYSVIFDQIHHRRVNFRFDGFWTIPMTKERTTFQLVHLPVLFSSYHNSLK